MNRKILSVGHMEFPLGQAQVQRQLLMAKAITLGGRDVTVLCRYGIYNQSDDLSHEGIFEGIHYIYCSGTTVRSKSILKRNFLKFKGLFNEFRYYKKYNRSNQLEGVIVSTNRFYNILYYFFLGKIFKVPTVVDNVEYWSSIKLARGFKRFDKILYDKHYFRFADKIICISDFLISKIPNRIKHKIVKIPVITDFDIFQQMKNKERMLIENYFLFCGSENYFDIIEFVIRAFEKSADRTNMLLVLVTRKTEKLKSRLRSSPFERRIMVFERIPYVNLINLYCNSEALIIPMRNTDQDKARFPHKIGEYCASGKPIITNPVGEVLNYFNASNALLCESYDVNAYSRQMIAVANHEVDSNLISQNSYNTGLRNFNYRSYTETLINLF